LNLKFDIACVWSGVLFIKRAARNHGILKAKKQSFWIFTKVAVLDVGLAFPQPNQTA